MLSILGIAVMLVQLYGQSLDGRLTVAELLDGKARLAQGGLDTLITFSQGNLTMLQWQDLAAALNRWRAISSRGGPGGII